MLDSYEAFSDIMTEIEFKTLAGAKKNKYKIFAVLKTDMREIPYLFFLYIQLKAATINRHCLSLLNINVPTQSRTGDWRLRRSPLYPLNYENSLAKHQERFYHKTSARSNDYPEN